MSEKIRVLLADDHSIVRAGIRLLLQSEPDIEIVGEAEEGRGALEQTRKLVPDVVLMDLSMPGMSGMEATRLVHEQCPQSRVLVLTMHENEEYFFEVLNAGACGYVLKKSAPTELIAAIRAVHQEGAFLCPTVTRRLLDDYLHRVESGEEKTSYGGLSEREREILKLVAEGYTNREIADRLFLSVKTVERHRSNIMDKLNLHSRTELVKYAIRKKLIDIADPGS